MEDTYKPIEIIYEAIEQRSPLLKELEIHIEALIENRKDKKALDEATKLLKKFSRIDNLVFTIKPNISDAFCITIYKDFFNKTLFDVFKKEETINRLPNIKYADKEASKYVDRIYIILGYKLMKKFNAQENVAILLHEIGHTYNYTTNLPNIALWINNKIRAMHMKVLTIYVVPFIGWMFGIMAFILGNLSKTLSFMEHRAEFNADIFTTKYGYGEEIARVLYSLGPKPKKAQDDWFNKIIKFIYNILKPGASHPTSEKRICEIKKKMLDDYKKRYKEISPDLNIIFGQIKC